MSPLFKSYSKTTAACLVLAVAALSVALLAARGPGVLGPVVATVSAIVALAGTLLACGGAVVLARYRRTATRKPDLFLALNRSREATAMQAAPAPHVTRLRRWLARRLLGHDFVAGDPVEVRSWAEIAATLDDRGCLEQLPFMPEMLAMCGKRARVFRCVHRLFDYRKTRRMRHMAGAVLLVGAVCDGSHHGGCEAACHTIWKAAWLRRVEGSTGGAPPASSSLAAAADPTKVLQFGTQGPRYICQLTQLNSASQPLGRSGTANFLRPLVAGNVTPVAFAVAVLTYLFNELQRLRGGYSFPEFEPPVREGTRREEPLLQAGDRVLVRSSAEIRVTLNEKLEHRGMGFEPDMLKHCGHRHCVQAQVRKLIDIVSGEMRTLQTPAYMLRHVHFSGERQFFNAQYEPLFWRSAWLQRESAAPVSPATDGGRDPENTEVRTAT